MPEWVLISLVVINALSVVAFLIIRREISHFVRSHTHIVGDENQDLVNSRKLRVLRVSYSVAVLGVSLMSFLLFWS